MIDASLITARHGKHRVYLMTLASCLAAGSLAPAVDRAPPGRRCRKQEARLSEQSTRSTRQLALAGCASQQVTHCRALVHVPALAELDPLLWEGIFLGDGLAQASVQAASGLRHHA